MLCPCFKNEETRISSFLEVWPHRVDNLKPERMAKAGFLYRSSDDRNICFYCGLILYQWADPNIPEIELAKYWSACAYLEKTFETGFIAQHSNFCIPEHRFLSGMRFEFAAPEEAADPTFVRNSPKMKNQT